MSKNELSRRERERERHKQEILKAALILFSEKGFYNVSMQEIAEASEFGVGTLYNFFSSKDALFEEIITNCRDYVVSEIFQILDGPGTEKERLSNYIMYKPELIEKHRDVIKLFVSKHGSSHSKCSEIPGDHEIHDLLEEKLADLIEQGIKKGLFRSVDPLIAAKMLSAINEKLVFETAGNYEKGTISEMFAKVEHLFMDGLLGK